MTSLYFKPCIFCVALRPKLENLCHLPGIWTYKDNEKSVANFKYDVIVLCMSVEIQAIYLDSPYKYIDK